MDIHENARTLPYRRMLIVERSRAGRSVAAVAAAAGVTAKTVRKWRDRHAARKERQRRAGRDDLNPSFSLKVVEEIGIDFGFHYGYDLQILLRRWLCKMCPQPYQLFL